MRLEHLTSSQLRDALTRSSSAVDTGALAETARHAVLFGDGVLQAIASSQHSAFDSELFAAPVYRIPHAAAEDRVGYQQVHRLTLEVLERDGAAQVVRRIDAANFDELWALQALGYRIVDIGVTFRLVPTPERLPQLKQGLEVGPASDADIAALLDTAASIFRTSHFYVDPFYPEERANELHRRWLSNCHHAGLADVVLVSREDDTHRLRDLQGARQRARWARWRHRPGRRASRAPGQADRDRDRGPRSALVQHAL